MGKFDVSTADFVPVTFWQDTLGEKVAASLNGKEKVGKGKFTLRRLGETAVKLEFWNDITITWTEGVPSAKIQDVTLPPNYVEEIAHMATHALGFIKVEDCAEDHELSHARLLSKDA